MGKRSHEGTHVEEKEEAEPMVRIIIDAVATFVLF